MAIFTFVNTIKEDSPTMSTKFRILVLNGPNLNLLGLREPAHYGSQTLDQIISSLTEQAKTQDVELSHLQSYREYVLIEAFHRAYQNVDFIIIRSFN